MTDGYDYARAMSPEELRAKQEREAPLAMNALWSMRASDEYRNAVNNTRQEVETFAAGWEKPPTLWQRIKRAIAATKPADGS